MLITNFASGELSQNLNGRVDLPQYYQGAAKIENFDIIPTGGIKRRVGTERVAELSGNNRIIPFIVNKDSVFVFEIAPNLITIWKQNSDGTVTVLHTLETNWDSRAAIKELHYAQNYDTMIFVHRDFPPIAIQWHAGSPNYFTSSQMAFDFYPTIDLDDDFDYVMIPVDTLPLKEATTDGHGRFSYYKLSGSGSQLTVKDYPAGISKFYAVLNGKLYEYTDSWAPYGIDPNVDTSLFTDPNGGKYPGAVAFFNNRLFLASTRNEPQKVWASAAPDETKERYNDFATYKKYVTVTRAVKDADLHVFTCDINKSDVNTVTSRTILRNVTIDVSAGALTNPLTDYYVSGMGIPVGTKVVSATSNTITIDTAKIGFEEDEEVKENMVLTIQLWRQTETVSAEDYDIVVTSNNVTTADCSLFFELASDENDSIKFLSSNQFLTIGTESSVWSVASSITALNVIAQMQGRYGSDDLQGQAVETATVYFAQGKKGIREFYYNRDSAVNAFQTNNIALMSDHILRESAAVDFDYMTNPYSRLVIVRSDGVSAVMLYDKTNGIMAWSRIKLQKGFIRNCAITRGDDENDIIFFVVQDANRFFLERLDMGSEVYLDSRKLYDAESDTPADGYSATAILFNQTKNITCPYDDIPEDFIGEDDVVYIGYTYKSYIKSMPVLNNDVSGRRRITALQVRFLNSYMPVMKCTGVSDEKFTTIKTKPYSGIGKITYPGSTDYDVTFELEAEEPQAVNILSVDALTA
ncbi:MAG: hypothetical protein J6S67_03200 [Methanobrevibacter sp.]|nr:hypothetical protein [Methanobrevibacter sp.]